MAGTAGLCLYAGLNHPGERAVLSRKPIRRFELIVDLRLRVRFGAARQLFWSGIGGGRRRRVWNRIGPGKGLASRLLSLRSRRENGQHWNHNTDQSFHETPRVFSHIMRLPRRAIGRLRGIPDASIAPVSLLAY